MVGTNGWGQEREVRSRLHAADLSGHSSLIASIWPNKYPQLPPTYWIYSFLLDNEKFDGEVSFWELFQRIVHVYDFHPIYGLTSSGFDLGALLWAQ